MPTSNLCPQCGSPIPPGANFCSKCNAPVGTPNNLPMGTGAPLRPAPSDGSRAIKIVSIIGGCCAAVIATIIAFILLVTIYVSNGMTKPINEQLSALRKGDTDKAYTYVSKDFQNATPLPDFKIFVDQYPTLKNNKSVSFTQRKREKDQGVVKGILKATDGTTSDVEFHVIKEGKIWKVLSIQMPPLDSIPGQTKGESKDQVAKPLKDQSQIEEQSADDEDSDNSSE